MYAERMKTSPGNSQPQPVKRGLTGGVGSPPSDWLSNAAGINLSNTDRAHLWRRVGVVEGVTQEQVVHSSLN